MVENTNRPMIRFKGFTDAWGQCEFLCLVNRLSQQSDADNLPKVEFEDIVSGEGVLNKDVSCKFDNRKGIVFEPGNILFGKLRPYLKNWLFADFKGVALGDFWVFEANDVAPLFIYYLIQTEQYQEIANLSTGTKMPRSDWKTVSEHIFSIPSEILEQATIGKFFRTLENAINLHKRKLEGLKALKKGYLQQMFPQKGEKVPRVRFEGFTGEWAEKKLQEVANYRNGKAHEQNILIEGRYIIINSKFVSTNGLIQKYSNEQLEPLYMGEIAFVLSDVPNGRAIARTFLIDEDDKYTLNQRIAAITPHTNTNAYFLHQLLNRNQYFLKFDDGVGQTNLLRSDVEKFVSVYPKAEEQTAIGNFFRNLDEYITAQMQKLEQLKKLKAAYLQKMFI